MPDPTAKNTPGIPLSKTTHPTWLDVLREKVEGLRYGVVEVTVSDWEVTQIVQTEKIRLPATGIPRQASALGSPDHSGPAPIPIQSNFPPKTDQSAGGRDATKQP